MRNHGLSRKVVSGVVQLIVVFANVQVPDKQEVNVTHVFFQTANIFDTAHYIATLRSQCYVFYTS